MSTEYSNARTDGPLVSRENIADLFPYQVDMSSYLDLPYCTFDKGDVPYQTNPVGYHPTIIAHYALAHWNQYLATRNEQHRTAFLTQAYWLVEHELRITHEMSGWPISFPLSDAQRIGPWLSALTQGCAISVLTRAYQLTQESAFSKVASRAILTFERDILDGGVSNPIGEDGIFFEEVALYPATHSLAGCIFALFGLHDYATLIGNTQAEQLFHRSHSTMHTLLGAFDVGFWTRADLLHPHLSSPTHLALQILLLGTLARYSRCEHCARVASRWGRYMYQWKSRLRYIVTNHTASLWNSFVGRIRTALFPRPQPSRYLRVCVPVPSYPVTGGILTVLNGVAQIMSDVWQLEYMAQYCPSNLKNFIVHRFGAAKTTPWQFPLVWLYCAAGFWKLVSLMRHGAGYHIILPQDSIYTSAFSALAAKLMGLRVVCIDHATLTLLDSHTYRSERLREVATRKWLRHHIHRILFVWYWPSLHLLARISARFVDHFLVPGVAGDGVEEVCERLGIDPSRLTRFASIIDSKRHVVLDPASKASIREKKGLSTDDIVVAVVCRLAPEKGLDIALESISQTFSALPPDLRARMRVIIAGDGPLYQRMEEAIHSRGLDETCCLWGEITAQEVLSLLAISDIFLYTSTRGACFSMAVLEAMASGCAVIASTQPISNAYLLAEGRGIAIPPNDMVQTSRALMRLVHDPLLCERMGRLARDYVAVYHSPEMFRRTLMRTTYWPFQEGFLGVDKSEK